MAITVNMMKHERDLIIAAEGNNLRYVEEALASGAKINHQTGREKMTALHLAAGNGNREMADYLLAQGADVSLLDRQGRTPAVVAIEFGFYELADRLTDLECKIIQKGKEETSAHGKI